MWLDVDVAIVQTKGEKVEKKVQCETQVKEK